MDLLKIYNFGLAKYYFGLYAYLKKAKKEFNFTFFLFKDL